MLIKGERYNNDRAWEVKNFIIEKYFDINLFSIIEGEIKVKQEEK